MKFIQRFRTVVNFAQGTGLITADPFAHYKLKFELPNGMILPIISNQKVNDYLKEIATICNINKNLTFHVANHTTFCPLLKINALHYAFNKQVTI